MALVAEIIRGQPITGSVIKTQKTTPVAPLGTPSYLGLNLSTNLNTNNFLYNNQGFPDGFDVRFVGFANTTFTLVDGVTEPFPINLRFDPQNLRYEIDLTSGTSDTGSVEYWVDGIQYIESFTIEHIELEFRGLSIVTEVPKGTTDFHQDLEFRGVSVVTKLPLLEPTFNFYQDLEFRGLSILSKVPIEVLCFGTVHKTCFNTSKGVPKRVNQVVPTNPDKGCCECVYNVIVLAESGAKTSDLNNDITTALYVVALAGDTLDIELEKFDKTTGVWTPTVINDNTYGTYYSLGFNSKQPEMGGVTIEWYEVLSAFGEGFYRFKATTAGLGNNVFYSENFCLREYNESRADDTVRFDWNMKGTWGGANGNDLYVFDTEIPDSIRVQGFFGRETTEYERTEIEYQNGSFERTRDEAINKYEFTSGLISDGTHTTLKCFAFLSDDLRATDFNLNNGKKYEEQGILMDSGYEPKYNVNRDVSRVTVNFKDKIQNKTRRFC